MKGILAVNKLNYIGKDGKLPWSSSEDLKHFKTMTDGCSLLVGYNTSLLLPKLKNRTMVIDDRNDYIIDGIDWCIGGKKTYNKYCHLFTELHISIINDTTVGDVEKPTMINLNPNCKIYYYYFNVD